MVKSGQSRPPSSEAADNTVGGLHALLRATQSHSLKDLTDAVETRVEPYYAIVTGEGRFASIGVVIRVENRGTGLDYPFSVREFWSTVDELELEAYANSAYEDLADQIEMIEGFPVAITVTYDVDESLIKPRHKRQQLDNGVVVQFPCRYPYRAPMSGRKTIADWITGRFERNYPGLQVRPPEIPIFTPLSELRSLYE